jgi:hypothetical protein
MKINAGMDMVSPFFRLVAFVDDDVELHRNYTLFACELFAAHREIVAPAATCSWTLPLQSSPIAILSEANIPEWQVR